MNCCENCIDDEFLAEQIRAQSVDTGNCDFCGSSLVSLISPEELQDQFQPIIDLYTISETSTKNLVKNLREDWALFGEMEESKCFELLMNIFPGEILQSNHYELITEPDEEVETITSWNEFREELMYKNRYFPQQFPDYKQLEELFGYLNIYLEEPVKLYRSRIESGDGTIPIDKMGAPPKEKVQAGRANPVGIPYLYVSSDSNTAISEARPHKGDLVSVATSAVSTRMALVDLRDPRKSVSPFSVTEIDLTQLLADIGYLCRLGEELSKPVLPRKAQLEYLPSQLLCELIKNSGFHGVAYKSSVGSGDNYALFSENHIVGESVISHLITDTSISSTPI